MLKISFTKSFIHELNKCEPYLQAGALEKIELFKNRVNHKILRVHKLKGPLRGRWSFSVNFKTRVVFDFINKGHILLHSIGDHKIYD